MKTEVLLGRAELPGKATSASVARAFVRETLLVAGCSELDEAVLMVSELVANAVRHSDSGRRADGLLTVAVVDRGKTIQVGVTDAGSADSPRIQPEPGQGDESGRGLWLVSELAASWGWRKDVDGHVVWFEIPADGPGHPGRP
ncbi:ATP-binding protein [Sphaerisporangium corydalis]|uniref:ATP-binding protein n=1 Tax=Sphaerisporangium corydalis TaxID=1441875 RepID=A0ABV9EAT0_9ACTN|nr:ATP-binding protein [Sphaerisporangium corydalis]